MDQVTFDIEAQAAAATTNIGGDAAPTEGIQADASWEILELRRAIGQARDGLGELDLSQTLLDDVNRSLDAAANEAARPKPDRHRVAEHLAAATVTLREAGALVDAGSNVVAGLRRAVSLLGPIGLALVGAL